MELDGRCLEANIDYGNTIGHFVRLDVEMPAQTVNGRRDDGGPTGCMALTHEEAETLGRQLLARAQQVRELRGAKGQ